MSSSRVATITAAEWGSVFSDRRLERPKFQGSRKQFITFAICSPNAAGGLRVESLKVSWGIFQDGTGRDFGSAWGWVGAGFGAYPSRQSFRSVNHARASKFERSAYRIVFSARQLEFRTRPTHSQLLWFRSVSCRSLNRLFWSGFG